MSDEASVAVLASLRRAVNRESHVLTRYPGIAWQQLHNRLQFENGTVAAILDIERSQRSTPGAAPWVHRLTPSSESESILRTLDALDLSSGNGLTSCAVSTDGSWAIATSGGQVVRWDLASGNRLAVIQVESSAHHCAIDPADRRFAIARADGRVAMHDVDSAGFLVLDGHDDAATWCGFTADGRRIVSAGKDYTVRVWNVATGQELATFEHVRAVEACAIDPSGTLLVSATHFSTLRMWDLDRLEELAPLEGSAGIVYAAAFSPDARHFILASGTGMLGMPSPRDRYVLRVWDVDERIEVAELSGHAGPIGNCRFGPDGSMLASTGIHDNTIRVWDAESGTTIGTLSGHTDSVRDLGYSPDGQTLVSVGTDATARIWNLAATGELRRPGHDSGSTVQSCVFTADGRTLVTAAFDGTMRVWDTATLEERHSITGWQQAGLAIDPAGTWIAANSNQGGDIGIWQLPSGDLRHTLTGHTLMNEEFAVAPDGSWLASASMDRTVRIWDVAQGSEKRMLKARSTGRACAVSPCGRWLATLGGGLDMTLALWDLGSDAPEPIELGQIRSAASLAVSPNGRWLVTGAPARLDIWDLERREHGRTIAVDGGARQCAVSPDSRLVFTCGGGTFRAFEAWTGKLLCFLDHAGAGLAAHPSQPLVALGDQSGGVHTAELVGIEYGPLSVTAGDLGGGQILQCTVCSANHPFNEAWRGEVIACPACDARLRVNPFLVGEDSLAIVADNPSPFGWQFAAWLAEASDDP